MRRITFWILATLSVVVLLFGYDGSSAGTPVATPPAVVSGGASSSAGSTPSSSGSGSSGSGGSGSGSSTPSATPTKRATTTRTVTGGVAQTQWGPVQVALIVTGSTITKVTVVQYPSGNPRDTEINDYALPILIQETTSQQSANIDMVSGATVTSTGYLQSLQSAIDSAHL